MLDSKSILLFRKLVQQGINVSGKLWIIPEKNFTKENKEAQLKFSISACECLRARPLK